MNIQEFAKLQKDNIIENVGVGGTSKGHVTKIDNNGVWVAWGSPDALPFYYSGQGTAWFHWSRVVVPECVTCDQCGTMFSATGPTQCPRCERA